MKFKSKFPFPQMLDGRRVTTEIQGGKFRAIVWCKESGILDCPGAHLIYTIYECDDLWTLREIFQYHEPKHNSKSLCYLDLLWNRRTIKFDLF